jgi:hypothetical protein
MLPQKGYEKNIGAVGAGVSEMAFADVAAFLSVYTELFTVLDRSHRSIWGGLWYLVDRQTHLSLPSGLSGWLRPRTRATIYAE